jgi:Tfp pilus assembly protein PilN
MIKINLATRKQAVASSGDGSKAGGSASLSGMLTGFRNDSRLDGLKELPVKKFAVGILAVIAAGYLVDTFKDDELAKKETLLGTARTEQGKLKADLAKTKGYEDIKKSLDADELTLRTKIETIQKLIADRQASPKMMTAISSAIPAEVWLKGLKIEDAAVAFKGASMGFNPIADFIKNLKESAYFGEVQLQGTKQEVDETGAPAAGFELQARRR